MAPARPPIGIIALGGRAGERAGSVKIENDLEQIAFDLTHFVVQIKRVNLLYYNMYVRSDSRS